MHKTKLQKRPLCHLGTFAVQRTIIRKLVKTNDHIFEVVGDDALGKAFENAEPGSFILHENLAYTGTDGPFCKSLTKVIMQSLF